jgi:hypothetical protein
LKAEVGLYLIHPHISTFCSFTVPSKS